MKDASQTTVRVRTRRWVVLLACVALAIGAVVWLARRREQPVAAVSVEEPPAPPATLRSWAPPAGASKPANTSMGPGTARLIKDVYADGNDVCPNEPVTVTVDVTTDHPTPLYVKIGAVWGAVGVVSFRAPGDYKISVTADDHATAMDTRTLELRVRDCGGLFQYVRVETTYISSRIGAYGITAHPVFARPECRTDAGKVDDDCAAAPPAGTKLRYAWDFGDGETAVTDEPYVEHDYSGRPQETMESTFLVRASVTSSGDELQGVASITLTNLAYKNKRIAHTIAPDAFADHLAKDGSAYRFDAHFYNHEKTALRLTKAKVETIPCDSSAKPSYYDLSARQILDTVDLPPGPSTTTGWVRGSLADDTYCQAIVTFGGDGPEGMPIEAVLGARLKPMAPTKVLSGDDPDPATQAELARTLEAMRLLGRDPNGGTVTAQEIRALQQRGLLK